MWVLAAMLSLAAGQDDALPRPKTPIISWLNSNDFPTGAVGKGKSGIVEADVSIGIDGQPVSCRGRLVAGDYAPYIAHTCAILLKRGAFETSTDDDGSPIHAGFRGNFNWTFDRSYRRDKYAGVDAVLTVARLPVPEKDARVVVRRVQAADGTMESCRVAIPSKSPALDRLACPAVSDVAVGSPIRDAAGTPVRGVRYPKVQFVEDPAGR